MLNLPWRYSYELLKLYLIYTIFHFFNHCLGEMRTDFKLYKTLGLYLVKFFSDLFFLHANFCCLNCLYRFLRLRGYKLITHFLPISYIYFLYTSSLKWSIHAGNEYSVSILVLFSSRHVCRFNVQWLPKICTRRCCF